MKYQAVLEPSIPCPNCASRAVKLSSDRDVMKISFGLLFLGSLLAGIFIWPLLVLPPIFALASLSILFASKEPKQGICQTCKYAFKVTPL